MKTTLDLPEALVRQIESRAEHKGQELREAVTELLWKALAASAETPNSLPRPVVKTDPAMGLPSIVCAHAALPAEEMTPARLADLLLNQEITWQHEAGR